MMMRDTHISPQNLLKFISKCQNSKIKLFLFSCGIIVAMATRLLNLQGVLFLNHNIQWLHLKYDDDRYLYLSTKVAKY